MLPVIKMNEGETAEEDLPVNLQFRVPRVSKKTAKLASKKLSHVSHDARRLQGSLTIRKSAQK